MALDLDRTGGPLALWSQLLDRLAQGGLDRTESARTLAALALVRGLIAPKAREASARAIAERNRSPALAVFLAGDIPAVASAYFTSARLPTDQWLTIMADLGPVARNSLRRRDDLDAPVVSALAALGPSDTALPDLRVEGVKEERDDLPRTAGTPIAELVQRIERYRDRRARDHKAEQISAFARAEAGRPFVADANGLVRGLTGTDRSRFVGLMLDELATADTSGVDAGVVRSFERRDPIVGGRLQLVGKDGSYDIWSIAADPIFDELSGRFTGYRGFLAPLAGSQSPLEAPPSVATTVREMMHELRSPLNAIQGFAQMIEGQFLGPVSAGYRNIAARILADADNLRGAFEDLDDAARAATQPPPAITGVENLAEHARRIFALQPTGDGPSPVRADAPTLESLLERVQQFLAPAGEPLAAKVTTRGDVVSLCVSSHDNAATKAVTRFGRDFTQALVAVQGRLAGGDAQLGDREAIVNFSRVEE